MCYRLNSGAKASQWLARLRWFLAIASLPWFGRSSNNCHIAVTNWSNDANGLLQNKAAAKKEVHYTTFLNNKFFVVKHVDDRNIHLRIHNFSHNLLWCPLETEIRLDKAQLYMICLLFAHISHGYELNLITDWWMDSGIKTRSKCTCTINCFYEGPYIFLTGGRWILNCKKVKTLSL